MQLLSNLADSRGGYYATNRDFFDSWRDLGPPRDRLGQLLGRYYSLIVIISIPLLVFVFVSIGRQKPAEDKFVSEMASYAGQQLPRVPLIELKSRENFWDRVEDGEALLVFSVTGCDACGKEMQVIAENTAAIKSVIKTYVVMFEDRKTVDQYAQAHNIDFPILLDEGGKLREELRLKYFPANFKLKDSMITEAWFGIEGDKREFLKRINVSQE